MPGWLIPVIAAVLGSGGLASLIIPVVNHKFQQRRDRDRESREARAAYIAQQREMCIALLDAVIRFKNTVNIIRPIHDDLASRWTARRTLEMELQQFPSHMETILRFRRELDLEPNAQLQDAIDRFGDAGIAYIACLRSAMYSWWNVAKLYMGKAPQDEVNRLAEDFDARTQELQAAVREHMASLEAPAKAVPARRLPRLPRQRRS
jgi:hypothetical protein